MTYCLYSWIMFESLVLARPARFHVVNAQSDDAGRLFVRPSTYRGPVSTEFGMPPASPGDPKHSLFSIRVTRALLYDGLGVANRAVINCRTRTIFSGHVRDIKRLSYKNLRRLNHSRRHPFNLWSVRSCAVSLGSPDTVRWSNFTRKNIIPSGTTTGTLN